MELIYAYIDDYRTMTNQAISFSNKFIVKYENDKLYIEENREYVDVYPDNILNINGIIGKNASGKTSLISIIGDKIDSRHHRKEIFNEKCRNPHKEINILELLNNQEDYEKSIKYKYTYFLLYHLGKDSEGRNEFVFETDCPEKYKEIFTNYDLLNKQLNIIGAEKDYYIGKGWFPFIFKCEENGCKLMEDVSKVMNNTSIIKFYDNKKIYKKTIKDGNEPEHKICLKRKYSYLEGVYTYNKLKYLVNNMKQSKMNSESMFKNDRYILNVVIEDIKPTIDEIDKIFGYDAMEDDVIINYKNHISDDFTESQKIMLAIVNKLLWYVFNRNIDFRNDIKNDRIAYIKELNNITKNIENNTYDALKEKYKEQFKIIVQEIKNNYFHDMEFDENVYINSFESMINEFEKFFGECDKKDKHILYEYEENKLKIYIMAESNLEIMGNLFKNVLEESLHKYMEDEDSVFQEFFKLGIDYLSEGESYYLSLYTSIYENITEMKDIDNFILLFDEIESRMHPELCRCLINDLIVELKKYDEKKFQIIISSHSPFIVGDMLKDNIVLLNRKDEKTVVSHPKDKSFGQNIHKILKDNFFMESTIGEYSKKIIQLIEYCLNLENIEELNYDAKKFLFKVDSDDCNDKAITWNELYDTVNKLISCIGEDVLQRYFAGLIEKRRLEKYSPDELINYYERKIEQIKGGKIHG